jgi:hypothetical protein
MVDEVAAEQIFRFREDGLQRLLEVRGIVREGDDANLSALPGVLVIKFGHGHVKARAEAVLQAAQNLAFVFKGMRVRDEDFQRQQTDRHDSQLSSLLTESLVMTNKNEKQIPRRVRSSE